MNIERMNFEDQILFSTKSFVSPRHNPVLLLRNHTHTPTFPEAASLCMPGQCLAEGLELLPLPHPSDMCLLPSPVLHIAKVRGRIFPGPLASRLGHLLALSL